MENAPCLLCVTCPQTFAETCNGLLQYEPRITCDNIPCFGRGTLTWIWIRTSSSEIEHSYKSILWNAANALCACIYE